MTKIIQNSKNGLMAIAETIGFILVIILGAAACAAICFAFMIGASFALICFVYIFGGAMAVMIPILGDAMFFAFMGETFPDMPWYQVAIIYILFWAVRLVIYYLSDEHQRKQKAV